MFDGRHLCVMIPSDLPVLWCFVMRRLLVLHLVSVVDMLPEVTAVEEMPWRDS
jgi:hypothetical protein